MNLKYDRSITFPKGFRANGIASGIKQNGLPDLGIIVSDSIANTAAVFTQNKFQAAPILVSKDNLAGPAPKSRGIIVNSGCANALTGKAGIKSAQRVVAEVAKHLRISKKEVLTASTGVIGRQLPTDVIIESIPALVSGLDNESDGVFSQSIMTTDKFPKQVAVEVPISKNKSFRIGATAKGAGMIHPNMATMLCFITTDADIEHKQLQTLLRRAVGASFNTITVDGDTSTNDSVFLMANGLSGTKLRTLGELKIFESTLKTVLRELATMIVRDGEGATRFVRLIVEAAATYDEAVKVGRAIGVSPLVKTAIFGGDPNWGRVLSAVGNCEARFNPAKVELRIGSYSVFKKNEPQKVDLSVIEHLFSQKEIEMTIRLNAGRESAQVFTCDLSYDYVKINGEYTT
ncbi:MAG: bifunctional glutamate N-acetyltransferase/amino-acid acetyltransferase ArgJ [Bacteroidetes bacterium]|nr:bifunctional glutamate N-acetyltransferase/amino-acid acetyltransferase ArgJ [Bacteroidota bacterium]